MKRIQELKESEAINSGGNNNTFLYPNINDENFNIKIAKRKEFYDTTYNGNIYKNIEERSEQLCNATFELSPHQVFVKNFLSSHTPYNSLLLYHGLGSGKTCSAITVAEETREYMKQVGKSNRIMIIASPNVQENFKKQLFDKTKLEKENGLWNITSCVGNKLLREINPVNMKDISKKDIISKIELLIKKSYIFMGYIEFAGYITKLSNVNSEDNSKNTSRLIKKKLNNKFRDRLVIIDEVHNINSATENTKKRVATELLKLVKNVDNMKLLLLSATPMYNNYKEITWLINLMNLNDNRATIKTNEVFDNDGYFKESDNGEEIGYELLKRKTIGYVSFIRGENPYTFPYRLWPSMFSPENTFQNKTYPRNQLNGNTILEDLNVIDVYLTNIGDYQKLGYNYIINRLKDGYFNSGRDDVMPDFKNMDSFGYTLLQKPLEALNIIYPDDRIDSKEPNFNPIDIVGKEGLNRIMAYTETLSPPSKYNYEYKTEKYGRIFSPDIIGKYSSKIKKICDNIVNSTGVVLVYSQYLDGGVVPLALALEELGFIRGGGGKSLLKNKPAENKVFNIDGNNHQAKYVMITGDKKLSPNTGNDINILTNIDNKYGKNIKVVLISQAGTEGLDFKFVRQVHVMEPWWHMNRIEQIIGRAVRTCSHKDLPFIERNVEIYLYGTLLDDTDSEAADLYVYRHAQLKALQIGRVTRLLKEVSADCLLNISQSNFTQENMNQIVKQKISSGPILDYPLGDKPYTSTCDYMEKCQYTCNPDKPVTDADVVLNTLNENHISVNNDIIIRRIKDLMKEKFFYRKDQLITNINLIKKYPLIQINSALIQLIEDKNEFISDKYGRLGNLINIGDLYLFQPLELNNKQVSLYDRSTPIDKKNTLINISGTKLNDSDPITNKEKGKNKLKELNKLFNRVKQDKKLGQYDKWYNNYNSVLIKILESEYIEGLGITPDIMDDILVAHIIEENDLKSNILNNKNDEDLEGFEEKIKKYFTVLSSKREIEEENMNKIFGFNAKLGNTYVSKVKNINNTTEKGSTIKNKNSNELNVILKLMKMPDEFMDNYKLEEKRVLVELLLRIFNTINYNDKTWYLTKNEYNTLYDFM